MANVSDHSGRDAHAPDRTPRPSRRQTLTITGIAAGGAGVGRLADGRVAFVQRTAPGDSIDAGIFEEKPRWVRARLIRVRTPSTVRRDAPCPHYARCGGCTLEHMDYPAQLEAKASIVAETLRRIGGLETAVPPVVAAPDEFRYRNRVSFTLLRTGAGGVIAGFHELERPDRVLDVNHRCLLPEPFLARVWRSLRTAWGDNASRLPPGETLRLTLRATLTGEATLLIDGGYGPGTPEELIRRVPEIVSIWRRTRDEAPVLLAGAPFVTESWNGQTVRLAGGVFLQVNRTVAREMETHVAALAGDVNGKRVIDAYCGVGLHARRFALAGASVVAIETDPIAIAEAMRACGASAQCIEGRVEDVITDALPADLVVVNPPRAGLDAAVAAALNHAPPARIVYVSCDPATLARDAARLSARFTITSLRCFDLFPQTAHVETVAEFACATS
jgi:tRNA/tmRNA/rRNA uracil-C5-methylase (TrmA/RlmC/RlmD family)